MTLTERNGEWRDRWYVHDEVDVIAPPNRNTFRMIYLTHRWARAPFVGESSRCWRPRGAVNSRCGGKCLVQPGCHFQGTRWIFLRARPSNRNWARGYETNIHSHKRRVEKGATATATVTTTTATRVRAIRVWEETRDGAGGFILYGTRCRRIYTNTCTVNVITA